MSILAALLERLPGRAHGPGSAEYDAGRTVFAGVGEPEAVVRPKSAADVAEAVRAAIEFEQPIAVRSGGHGAMPATEGVVVDLAELSGVEVHDDGTVSVGAGAHWGDVAAALAPHGLGVSSGDTLDVGVGGLALGGGIGWLVRTHGLTIDAVREVEVVTAAGAVVVANDESHPDLFWALRGGGGNFGLVTRFRFSAVPVDGLVGGQVAFDQSDVGAVLRAWREVTAASSDELNSTLLVLPPFSPELPAGPQLAVAYRGTEAELRDLLAPLLSLPSVSEVSLGPVAYGDLLEAAPPGKPPFRFVGGNGFAPELSDELLEACEQALAAGTPTMLMLRAMGGSFTRVAPDATPIAFRDAEALVMVNGILPADASEEQAALAQLELERPLEFTSGRYSNFTQEYGDDVLETIYPPATLDRLRRIKAQYDPGDVFHGLHHIAPA
ncbi:FAD-binding oxidoreductase [Agromyces aerolatus]|uniref:FAD-binding oxidoreductase n=1 Tax=Agromyces sp. LY-1074 TaxID=3074080 RepID=UPI00285D7AE1|nr:MULTISPECIES: FAD-binding oxidoreductase [unclassified Agromyces]MDR5701901.1 FAD-binding oxidoreductase [Agromyces sp. LY-1074]MDR5708131.1 FAD-binding oxidoreductase [Agromyces sp. LY-1358]